MTSPNSLSVMFLIGTGYMPVDTALRPGMSGTRVSRRSWGTHLLEDSAISSDRTPRSENLKSISVPGTGADLTSAWSQVGFLTQNRTSAFPIAVFRAKTTW
jgi:hypothetical protein